MNEYFNYIYECVSRGRWELDNFQLKMDGLVLDNSKLRTCAMELDNSIFSALNLDNFIISAVELDNFNI